MKNLVGIKFKKQGKVYSFDTGDLELRINDEVIVETENGRSVGCVVTAIRSIAPENAPEGLKKVVRKLSEDDLRAMEDNRRVEEDAFAFCQHRIQDRNLPMKLVEVEYLFDRTKLMFYFTAENRVDFRDLVKDLVQKFKTRIELRQIGVRNETRIMGGVGICGRVLCCSMFLQNLDTVSVKMAKEQNMLLNPEKISGCCGRLMCCLAFEFDSYRELKRNFPKVGKTIDTPKGRGKVIRQNILRGNISVLLENGGGEVEIEVAGNGGEPENNGQ
ncbi:MAG: stage 0 sporulation family protein [Syntrophales bacterium]|nr:stage 0 sporulation family protein [Syntrophales bacterium]MDD5532551.1 stage 0 sporulation family protein [Syntrophales bacterium]HPL64265.1 stage 0 sporulation family protein [Syntrophales bacterium]